MTQSFQKFWNVFIVLNREHQAAVKAVAWCPWQSGILATGGGTADKTIKIWNINSGTMIKSIDTKSQVINHEIKHFLVC